MNQLKNALDALRRGLKVFPCKPKTKDPATPHGVLDATTDEAQIRRWWARNPNYNVAVTGGVIVDCDTGLTSLEQALNFAKIREFPETLVVRTGRRSSYGVQFHFSGSLENGNYAANGVSGEIRCFHEYGLWHGSIHPISGERYEIVVDLPRAPCPPDLLKDARKKKASSAKPKPGFKVGEGDRFYWLRSQCGRLVNAGLSGEPLFQALQALNLEYCVPPKEEQKVQELAHAGTTKFEANVEPPPSQQERIFGADRCKFLEDWGEAYYKENELAELAEQGEERLFLKLWEQNLRRCIPPLPTSQLRHLCVDLFERISGLTAIQYPGMYEDDEQNATDTGYAKHLIRDYGRLVRYNKETGEWFTYKRGVWSTDHDVAGIGRWFKEMWVEREKTACGILTELSPQLAEIEQKKAEAERQDEEYVPSMLEQSILQLQTEQQAILKYALRGQQSKNINSAIELARTELGIDLVNADFDSNPLVFNAKNSTLDLASDGEFINRAELLCTHQSPVIFNPGIACPLFDNILKRSLENKQEVIEYLQDFFGLCLSGVMTPDIPIFLGEGANGKSLIRNIIAGVLGSYHSKASMSTFLASKQVNPGGARSDLAAFRGKRLITSSEANRKVMLDMELLKDLTGGEEISAREMYRKSKDSEFKPQAKLFLLMNHPPRIIDQSEGTWRRLKYIHFDVIIPIEERNDKLADQVIATEGTGILNWMMTGWERVRGRLERDAPSLVTPKKIADDTKSFKEKESVISRFFEEECEAKAEWKTKSSEVYACYAAWCKRNNEYQETSTELALALARHCADQNIPLETNAKILRNTARGFIGLKLKKWPPFTPHTDQPKDED